MRSLFAVAGLAAAAAAFLAVPAHAELPYGPETCKDGYVWRDAAPGDTICVPPASRDRAAADNAAASSRVQPGGGPYGPNTCRQGFVWREAFPGDVVCVTPDVRTETKQENELGASRRVLE